GVNVDYIIYKNASLSYDIPAITLDQLEEMILKDISKPFSIIVTANAMWFANDMQEILRQKFKDCNVNLFSLIVKFDYKESYIEAKKKELEMLQTQLDVYTKLEIQLGHTIKKAEVPTYTEKPPKIIWVCWLQGMDNAPSLVQSCYRTLQNSLPDYEKILITTENFNQYVDIDPIILGKWKKGIISNTMFSNVLRLELLIKHGGIWMDSTILFTGDEMPKFISDSPLFMYKRRNVNMELKPSGNWFIGSCKNHILLTATRDLFIQYWHNNDELIHYSLFYFLFRLVVNTYTDLWDKVSCITVDAPLVMGEHLTREYDKERFEVLINQSPFHKLTYKLAPTVLENQSNYYNYIIKNF
ncbi:MAG: hypothetical protein ATN35_09065, partial [Epulopiscium sp. Nele67-Bin004]